MASRRASCAGSRATKPGQLRDDGLPAPRTHLRESRVLPGLEPPPLVVGQMQLERVQLVEREKVDDLLNELGRVEVARDVEEDPAMAEAGASSIATAGDAGALSSWSLPDLASRCRAAGTIGYRPGSGTGPLVAVFPAHAVEISTRTAAVQYATWAMAR